MGQMMKKIDFEKNELLDYHMSGQKNDNLSFPVYAYIIPDMVHQWILHIFLSLGIFETEVDLTMHRNLCDDLRYYKIIGTDDDEVSLKQYSRFLLQRVIEEQLGHFPKTTEIYIGL